MDMFREAIDIKDWWEREKVIVFSKVPTVELFEFQWSFATKSMKVALIELSESQNQNTKNNYIQ